MAVAENAQVGRVFEYTDYREFLRHDYEMKKQKRVGWSLESWARRLGIRSKSTLAMILNGQRHPGDLLTAALVQYFQFSNEEAEYFHDLVEWRKAKKGGRLDAILLERLLQRRSKSEPEILRKAPEEEGEFRTMTFAIGERELPKAKQMLRDWMEQFADSIEAHPDDRIYQLEICFFPLSRKRGNA